MRWILLLHLAERKTEAQRKNCQKKITQQARVQVEIRTQDCDGHTLFFLHQGSSWQMLSSASLTTISALGSIQSWHSGNSSQLVLPCLETTKAWWDYRQETVSPICSWLESLPMWCLPSIPKYDQGTIPAFATSFIDLWNLLIPALLGGGGFITWDDLCKVNCNSCSHLVRRLSYFRVRQGSQGFSACPFWWGFLILFYQLCKNFPLNFCSFLKELQKESVIIVIFCSLKKIKQQPRSVVATRMRLSDLLL